MMRDYKHFSMDLREIKSKCFFVFLCLDISVFRISQPLSVTAPVSALPPDLSGQRVYCDVRGGRPPPAAPSKHEPWSASCLPRKPAGPWLHDSCSPEPQPRKTLQYMSARLRQQPRKLNASECWLILRSPSSQVNPSSRPPPDCLPIGVLLVV